MKDMLMAKKADLQKRGKKGFTLMELLIVVAIIAVLVAVAIPMFTSQLEKSRDAASVANLRSAYAQASAAVLTSNGQETTSGNVEVEEATTSGTTTTQQATVPDVVIESQVADSWSGEGSNLPFASLATDAGKPGTVDLTFTFNLSTGEVTALTGLPTAS